MKVIRIKTKEELDLISKSMVGSNFIPDGVLKNPEKIISEFNVYNDMILTQESSDSELFAIPTICVDFLEIDSFVVKGEKKDKHEVQLKCASDLIQNMSNTITQLHIKINKLEEKLNNINILINSK